MIKSESNKVVKLEVTHDETTPVFEEVKTPVHTIAKQKYFLPKYGVTVEASDLSEAIKLAETNHK